MKMFFAHDPGGANAIAPLTPEFEHPLIFGKGPALRILPDARELPENAIAELRPDFLITGTSASDFAERDLWREAEAFGIPSMAILDSWCNYGIRFSNYGLEKLHLFDGTCDRLPTYICVMDDMAKEDMIKDGVPADRIRVLGNPHFEEVFLVAQNKKGLRSSSGLLFEGKTILFASQPFDDIYYKGSEEIVLKDLVKVTKTYEDATIVIRKHPREQEDKFKKYLNHRVIMDDNADVYDSILQSEMIVSVDSMVLLEALFFKKKILSYQPRSKNGKDDFILTRNHTLPFINDFDTFKAAFDELFRSKENGVEIEIPHMGIIKRIKTFIEEQTNGKTCN